MNQLYLKFRDANGDDRRSRVDGEMFVVGRHSESDLCIPDGRLSRHHLRIERFEDVYVASDAGSSNGTTLNGQPLMSPTALNDGDVIGLGGFDVVADFESAAPPARKSEPEPFKVDAEPVPKAAPASDALPSAQGMIAESQPEAQNASSSMLLLLLIPVFGLILLLFGGGVIYLLVSQPTTTAVTTTDDSDDLYGDSNDKDDKDDGSTKTSNKTNSTSVNSNSPVGSNTSTTVPSGSNTPSTTPLGETAKIEQNGSAFLRLIAQNNPRAFLTGEQAQRLSSKVKQLSGSSSLAENLKNAQKNSSALKSLASSKNLKPQFLAIAAVAKLGGGRGDVLQTAQGMTDILDKLTTHLGNELADDSLLVIAAYGQGTAGDFMKMRNMLQDLANKSPQSSREIRSIWFLQKNGKITQGEFESALNFLAIGTIAQNPKEFGVNAEALSL